MLIIALSVTDIGYSQSFSSEDTLSITPIVISAKDIAIQSPPSVETLSILCTVKRIEKYSRVRWGGAGKMYVITVESEKKMRYSVISYETLQFDREKIEVGYWYVFDLIYPEIRKKMSDGSVITAPMNYLDYHCFEDQVAGRELGKLYRATNLMGLYIDSPILFRTRKEARRYKKKNAIKGKIRKIDGGVYLIG